MRDALLLTRESGESYRSENVFGAVLVICIVYCCINLHNEIKYIQFQFNMFSFPRTWTEFLSLKIPYTLPSAYSSYVTSS